jgi:hypothetical protein
VVSLAPRVAQSILKRQNTSFRSACGGIFFIRYSIFDFSEFLLSLKLAAFQASSWAEKRTAEPQNTE